MFALDQLTKKKTTKSKVSKSSSKSSSTVPPKPSGEPKVKKIQTRKKKIMEESGVDIPSETEEKIFSRKNMSQDRKPNKQTALQKYLSLSDNTTETLEVDNTIINANTTNTNDNITTSLDASNIQMISSTINTSNISEDNSNEKKKTDVKSYGIGIIKKDRQDVNENENLILHIPVTLEHKKNVTFYADSPVPYFADMTQDILHTKEKKTKVCRECFITDDGNLLYCDACQEKFNEKQNSKRNLEKLIQARELDDKLFTAEDGDEILLPPQVFETKMEGDHPLPVYDPKDVIDNSVSVISSTVKPSSYINQEIDNRDPTRDDYEKLKYEYELLEQRYSKLLNENRTTHPQDTHVNNHLWNDRMKIIEMMKQAKMRMTKAFELPSVFGDKDVWPKQVTTCCMHDAHPFDTLPVPLPLNYNQSTNTFKVFGCFCSFQCMLGFKKGNRSLDHIDTSLIFFFLNKFQAAFGRIIPEGSQIHPAPSPYSLLNIYGGPMTIEQYRSTSQHISIQCELIGFPLEPVPQFLQVTNQLINAELDVGFLDNLDQKKTKKLKIVRTKPLPNHKNRLEASMGLFIDHNLEE